MPQYVHLSQLVLSGLTFALSLAVLGTAAHTYDVYRTGRLTNPWWVPLWDDHFNVRGVTALITSSVAATMLSAIYIIFSFIRKLDLPNRPTYRAVLIFATTIPACLATLCSLIYAHVLNHRAPDTIQTWTCAYSNSRPSAESVPSSVSNNGFGRICAESKFALYTTLVIFLLNFFMLGLAVVGWLYDQWTARKPTKEWSESNSMEMAPNGP